ncbi:MAG: hypothetical protein ABI823_07535 [Bryobacteraceae bacterium]
MGWIVPFVLSLAAGWFLARTLTAGSWRGPRWAAVGVELALAALYGPGLASIGFFALTYLNAANQASAYGMTAALALSSGAAWWRFGRAEESEADAPRAAFPWKWALLVAAVAGAGLFLLDFQTTSAANPSGEWDATAIWNLRARFLTGGSETWRRAVSAELGGHMTGAAHPGYPLFLSSFIAMQWISARSFTVAVPIAASLLFSLGLWVLLTAGLASRRSVALGALGGLLLVASEVFVSQAASQYSDLLQGLAFLAVLLLLEATNPAKPERMLLAAGLASGFAPWIKNEGLPVAIAAFAVIGWKFGRRGLLWSGIGALPGLFATLALKLVAEGRESMIPATIGEVFAKIVDVSRWWQALMGFAKAVAEASSWWAHPLLLTAVLIAALGLRPAEERRARMWLWIPVAAAVAAEYGLYLVTTAELAWHISTSVGRLLAQVWPALIWLALMQARVPEEHYAVAEVVPAREADGKKRKRVRG